MLPAVLHSTNNISRPFLPSVYKTSFIHFSSLSDFIICTIICLQSISLLMDILVVFSFVFLFCFYYLEWLLVFIWSWGASYLRDQHLWKEGGRREKLTSCEDPIKLQPIQQGVLGIQVHCLLELPSTGLNLNLYNPPHPVIWWGSSQQGCDLGGGGCLHRWHSSYWVQKPFWKEHWGLGKSSLCLPQYCIILSY